MKKSARGVAGYYKQFAFENLHVQTYISGDYLAGSIRLTGKKESVDRALTLLPEGYKIDYRSETTGFAVIVPTN
jgi:hypothetical protein